MTVPTPSLGALMLRTLRYPYLMLVLLLTLSIVAPVVFAAQTDTATVPKNRQVAVRLMADLTDASWIKDGNGSQIVYMFFDPNCPYCHAVFDSFMKIRKDMPNLQFRWVPVGMLTPTSTTKAAAIIQAKDPLKAFYESENNYGFLDSGNGGGIEPAKHVTAKASAMLLENLSILQGDNLYAIPIILFQADDGLPFSFSGARPESQLRAILKHVAKGNFGGGKAVGSPSP
ncbi:thioredoxin fold domain-containing protein [Halothiobacillus sp.]|uniref:thioredoxin fold domain-containing protein n=1 Tax=Halothiobacillus sp. TaxID=1891311 RepID=UPI002AD4C727|nr:thioredoxin fold domain-containing protein [Halothiobacillus sp.]